MNDEGLPPLAEDMQRLLMSERAAPTIPPAMQAKIAARLAATISMVPPAPDAGFGGGDLPAADPSGAAAGAAAAGAGGAQLSPLAALASKPLLLAALAFGVGTGAGVVGTTLVKGTASTSEPAVIAAVAALDAGVTESVPVDAMVLADESDAAQEAHVPTVTPTPTRPTQLASAKDKALAAERALLELSRTALTRGDFATALQELTRHKQEFRDGRLVEERDALWVQALVLAGSKEQARIKAEAFKNKYPKSLFLPVMDHVLAESP